MLDNFSHYLIIISTEMQEVSRSFLSPKVDFMTEKNILTKSTFGRNFRQF